MATNYKLTDGNIVRCNNPIENTENKTITAEDCLINIGGEYTNTTIRMPSHKVGGAYGSKLQPEKTTESKQLDYKKIDKIIFKLSDVAYVWVD